MESPRPGLKPFATSVQIEGLAALPAPKNTQYFTIVGTCQDKFRKKIRKNLKKIKKSFKKIKKSFFKKPKLKFWQVTQSNTAERRRRVAILFFGLLNTFDQIYQESSGHVGIYKAIKALNYNVDVFFDTSELSFLKIPSSLDAKKNYNAIMKLTKGKRLMARVSASSGKTKDYLVLEDSATKIQSRLRRVMGKDLVSLHFTEVDPSTWSGPKYFLNMIKTYLYRKKRLLATCLDYAIKKHIIYDAIIIARPDSAFKVRSSSSKAAEDVSHVLSEDLMRVITTGETGVDHWPHNAEGSEAGVHMLKGAIVIASHKYAEHIGGLIDIIDEKGYKNTYGNPAFLCENCKALFRGSACECPNCGSEKPLSIENWPEYKYAEHVKAGANPFFVLGITGDTVRK